MMLFPASALSLFSHVMARFQWRGWHSLLRPALILTLVSSSTRALASSEYKQLTWSDLRSVAAAKGRTASEASTAMVSLQGFMVPLEDAQARVREFLLVPMPMTCIHVPPPPPDQIVHVELPGGESAPVSFGPITVRGVFEVRGRDQARENVRFKLLARDVLECCR